VDVEQSLALHQALLTHLDVALLVADDSAMHVEANEAACRLLQRPRDAIVGRHLSELVAQGTRQDVDLRWKALLRDGLQGGVFPVTVAAGVTVMTRFRARANVVAGLHYCLLTPAEPPDATGPDDGQLTVCAWTNQVRWKGRWISLGEYLYEAHGIEVSHGICPDAYATLYRTLLHLAADRPVRRSATGRFPPVTK
jgi:PAS domain S-box-containing protein